jgi:hypothetical protein
VHDWLRVPGWTASLRQPRAAAGLLDLLLYSSFSFNGASIPSGGSRAERDAQIARWVVGSDVRHAVAEAFNPADSDEALGTLKYLSNLFAYYDSLETA